MNTEWTKGGFTEDTQCGKMRADRHSRFVAGDSNKQIAVAVTLSLLRALYSTGLLRHQMSIDGRCETASTRIRPSYLADMSGTHQH